MQGRTAIFQPNSTLFAKTLMVERFDDKYTRKLTQHEALDALWPVLVVSFKYLNSSLTTERNNASQPASDTCRSTPPFQNL